MGALVDVPQRFFQRTVGLLGLWSSSRTDDFLLSSGRTLPWSRGSLPLEEALHSFGLSWTVPVPESLLHSGPPSKLLEPITTAELMSVNPVILDDLKKKCKGSMQCVHDILATDNTKMGLQSLANEERYHNLALIFGNMPPIVTNPTVIQVQVNFTFRVQFTAQDPNNDSVSFSLLFPRPPLASIGSGNGILMWMPLNAQPVTLTIMVTDQQFSSLLTPVIQLCSCLNGGTCQYGSIAENHLQGKFQVVGCLCPKGFTGPFCGHAADACKGRPCFPGVTCKAQRDNFTCGECPPHTAHQRMGGYKCFENDVCLPPFPFPCHSMAHCTSTGYDFTCKCKPGFTGNGHNCTDINECMDPSACPNAKFECVNTLGSVQCSCRYRSTEESDGCGDSANPPGFNIFNVSMQWNNPGNEKNGLQKLQRILSMGFQNKFYSAAEKKVGHGGQAHSEYRINVSSDTPHWYVRDYLTRVSRHYRIQAAHVGDLDECVTKEAACQAPALCANTYGGYRCVCNGTMDVVESQSCILGEGGGGFHAVQSSQDRPRMSKHICRFMPLYPASDNGAVNRTGESESQSLEDQKSLILGLVLGIGIPLLLLLLLAALACFCCSHKKTVIGEIPHIVPEYSLGQYNLPPFNYLDPALHYRSHSSPRVIDGITVSDCYR
ncbi:mucin-like protein [Paramormyrops kingsleyae]|uniref:mucin-like protein n=1 Tax=Paramormyrops kingsleyae TaxID=1676925 RepID=UPI000CD5DC77|nr:mucin-like protein [Paramormyrops kingsleyae]